METGLVGALAAAAKQAREDAGITRSVVAGKINKTEDTIRKFEDGRTFIALNDLLGAYADTTGASLFELLDEAKATLKTKG